MVWAAAKLVGRAREIAPDYARRSAQAGTHMVSRLVTETGCFLATEQLSEGTRALITPPIGGVNIIVLNTQSGGDPDFAVRHELAHRLAGDVDEPTFFDGRSEEWSERVADLFALADMVPAQEIRLMRGRGARARPWREVLAETRRWCAYFDPQWDAHRIADRARLRLMLYRTQGI